MTGPALAIDAAEWFVDEAWRQHVAPRHWRRLPSRAGIAIRKVLPRLQQARATFFVPAQLVDTDPELLREIVRAGHEVGLSGLPQASRQELVDRWRAGRAALEAAVDRRVHGFRCAWVMAAGDAWWRAQLGELGFSYDATTVGDVADAVRGCSAAGEPFVCRVYSAWRLDDEQPSLMGLPKAVRARHEAAVQDGASALDAVLAGAAGSIEAVLGLSPEKQPASTGKAAPTARSEPAACRLTADVPRLQIIVPLKDEADGIAALFQELDNVTNALADCADCEFVAVDDGSTDRTWELLEQNASSRPRVQLVRHARNLGVAAAIRTGMQHSDAEWVASIDGDLSYDPMELRAMLALRAAADVVTASPYHGQGGVKNVPGWRLLLSRTLSFVYRVLLWRRIHTWTSCFRIYRRAFVADIELRNPGFLGTAELLVRVLRRGGRVVEHPCVLEARLLGFSKMRVLRTVFGHVGLLWLVLWRRIK